MKNLIEEFTESALQIINFYDLVKEIGESKKALLAEQESKLNKLLIDEDLHKTLKATLFLLLYNLIESTMRSGIEKIYDKMETEQSNYNQLTNVIKKRILQDIKSHISVEDLHAYANICIEREIIKVSFKSEKLFSGNIDGRKIKEVSEEFGFSCRTNAKQTSDGKHLLTVKTNRNNLAHGLSSFREVGQNYSIEDLYKIMDQTINYLSEILNNIKIYLDEQKYLIPATVP